MSFNKEKEAHKKLISERKELPCVRKYQLALDTIMLETCHIREVRDSIKVIKELVDKETPMKPKQQFSKKIGYCNRCNEILMQATYCDVCGQKIDWSDEK